MRAFQSLDEVHSLWGSAFQSLKEVHFLKSLLESLPEPLGEISEGCEAKQFLHLPFSCIVLLLCVCVHVLHWHRTQCTVYQEKVPH